MNHSIKLKVGVVYRNYRNIHGMYRHLYENPPEKIEYIYKPPATYLLYLKKLYSKLSFFGVIESKLARLSQTLFNTTSTPTHVDLLEYCQLLPNKIPDTPFIVDVEHALALFNHKNSFSNDIDKVAEILLNPKCRFIVSATKAAKMSMGHTFSNYPQLLSKIKVVYPSCDCLFDQYSLNDDQFESKDLVLLFIGKNIYMKGLRELLLSVKNIRSNENIKIYVISDAQKSFIEKYDIPGEITWCKPNLGAKELVTYYQKSHVLILPTYSETFGMVRLEALSCGIPVITTDQFAAPEIIDEGRTGFLLKSSTFSPLDEIEWEDNMRNKMIDLPADPILIHQLTLKLEWCIQNKKTLKQMGNNALEHFRNDGRFSVSKRARIMEDLYFAAVK